MRELECLKIEYQKTYQTHHDLQDKIDWYRKTLRDDGALKELVSRLSIISRVDGFGNISMIAD